MQYIPFLVILSGLAVCLASLFMGLVSTYRMGGWTNMMKPTPQGSWSLPRRLVWGGAMGFVFCNCLFIVLTWVPGAIPWR